MWLDKVFDDDNLIEEFKKLTGMVSPRKRGKLVWGDYIIFIHNKLKSKENELIIKEKQIKQLLKQKNEKK